MAGAVSLSGQVTHSVLAVEGSADPMVGNEPSISFDPRNPNKGLIGVNTSTVMRTSSPNLKKWEMIVVNPPQGFYGDPVMKTSKNGVVYLAHLSKNKEGKWPQFFDRIVFERSENGGETFSSTDVGFHEGKMQDKPWFSMDEWNGSKGFGNVYLTWTEFDKYGSDDPNDSSRIWFARSLDGGKSFENPIVISDRGGDANDDDATAEGANVAITKDGVIHAVWSRNDTIWYDCSFDLGKSWGDDRFVCEQFGGWNHDAVRGTMRVNGMPFVAADASGNLYIVYSGGACKKQSMNACKSRDVFVVCKYKGESKFSEPIVLSKVQKSMDDALHRLDPETPNFEMTEQYSPMIVTSPNKKRVFVAWQDRRRSATGSFFDLYGCEIHVKKHWLNGGIAASRLNVFENIRLSNTASVAPGDAVFMGDYIGLDWQKDIVAVYTGFDVYRSHPVIHLIKVAVPKKRMGLSKIKGVGGVLEPNVSLCLQENQQNKNNTLMEAELKRSDQKLMIWAEWPGVNNFTVEIKMGSQVVFSHVFENLLDSKTDFELPLSRFVPGPHEIVLRKKGRSVTLPLNLK